jgi:hypothetical protein
MDFSRRDVVLGAGAAFALPGAAQRSPAVLPDTGMAISAWLGELARHRAARSKQDIRVAASP